MPEIQFGVGLNVGEVICIVGPTCSGAVDGAAQIISEAGLTPGGAGVRHGDDLVVEGHHAHDVLGVQGASLGVEGVHVLARSGPAHAQTTGQPSSHTPPATRSGIRFAP